MGFNILSSLETLWVRVLRAKYGIKDDIPLNIVRSNCSFHWRALSKVWLSEDLIRRITSILPPHPATGPDKITWLGTSSQCFSIKSAYLKMESLWNPRKEAWNLPWKRRLSKFSTVGIINALQLAREALLLDLPREWRWQNQKEIKIEIGYLAIIEDWGNVRFFEAKLWGILDGVTLAQGRQHDRVLVQKDNMEVMGTIKESLSRGSNSALIRCILQLLQNEKVWSIEHVPRDENMETDSIPKMAF
ncbi:hypothetical protein Gogos_008497, partial [Gossypium gossypioides]|nr:hypothetical protein [Gossypium gossypioides]